MFESILVVVITSVDALRLDKTADFVNLAVQAPRTNQTRQFSAITLGYLSRKAGETPKSAAMWSSVTVL